MYHIGIETRLSKSLNPDGLLIVPYWNWSRKTFFTYITCITLNCTILEWNLYKHHYHSETLKCTILELKLTTKFTTTYLNCTILELKLEIKLSSHLALNCTILDWNAAIVIPPIIVSSYCTILELKLNGINVPGALYELYILELKHTLRDRLNWKTHNCTILNWNLIKLIWQNWLLIVPYWNWN